MDVTFIHVFDDDKFIDPTIKLFEEVIPLLGPHEHQNNSHWVLSTGPEFLHTIMLLWLADNISTKLLKRRNTSSDIHLF